MRKNLSMLAAVVAILFCTPLLRAQAAAVQQKVTISISVTDKVTGEAVPDAEVSMSSDNSGRKVKTDDSGRASVTVNSATPRYLSISVKKAPYGSMAAQWRNVTASQPLPEELAFALEPGTTIGGFVKDENGKPVKDAMVHLIGQSDNTNGTVYPSANVNVKTDENGKFTDSTVSPSVPKMWVMVEHKDFFKRGSYEFAPPMPELKAQTAVITVQHVGSIAGKVVGPDGAPVAGAKIGAGEEGWGDIRYRATSGSDGTFNLKGVKPGLVTFSVTSKDMRPAVVTATSPTTQPVEVKLEPGTALKLHVADRDGKPVSGVDISFNQWKSALIDYKLKTDSNGDAVWNGAPKDELTLSLSKKSFGPIRDRKITATADPVKITLHPPPKIDGTVVDAATGQPIPSFKVVQGITWGTDQGINWMSDRNGSDTAPKTGKDGKFSFTLSYPYPFHAVRIEAPDYLPAISKRFKSDEGPVTLEFKLEKGQPIVGVVHNPDGKPAVGATVYVVLPGKQFQVENGRPSEYAIREAISIETDAQGNFKIPPQAENMLILCMTDDGFARVDSKAAARKASSAPIDIKLQQWGIVEGTFMVGAKPGVGETMQISLNNQSYQQNEPHVWMSNNAPVDATGHFHFDRVVPGDSTLGHQVRLTDNMTGYSGSVPLKVEPGKTITLAIGGTGRPVIGRINVPKDFNGGKFTFQGGSMSGTVAATQPTTAAATPQLASATDAEKKKAFANWIKSKVIGNPEQDNLNRRNYSFKVEPDGKFRIDDVPAGTWNLNAQIAGPSESGRGGWSPPIGMAQTNFTVPEIPNGRSDEPLDIGEISPDPINRNTN